VNKRVLFISVHPDDETYGCGGTIIKQRAMGNEIYWLNLTGATIEHPHGFSQEKLDNRKALIAKIASAYGFTAYRDLGLPTQMLDTLDVRDIFGAIDAVVSEWKPEIIYLPNRSDVHTDHRIGFTTAYATTKNFRKPYIKQILMYETLSETEFAPALPEMVFIPNTFVDITDLMERKLEMVRMYDTELMPDPLPRSIHAVTGLAAYRGSRIGVRYAEAFTLLLDRS